MSKAPRNLPRYLPTLTEVVQTPGSTRTSDPVTPDLEEIVHSVMQRIDRVIEHRLREEAEAMVRTLVSDQLPDLSLLIRQELERVVRQAVSDAMTLRADPDKPK